MAANACYNDLQLYKNLIHYNVINKTISEAAASSFRNHLWYLTEEFMPLSLFDMCVPSDDKASIANWILTYIKSYKAPTDHYGVEFGKPL